MKIGIINTTGQRYGGTVYEKMLAETLSDNFKFEFINTGIKSRSKLRYLEAPLVLWRLFKTRREKNFDVVIRSLEASLFLNKKPIKNIALIHHVDSSQRSLPFRIIYFFLEKYILYNLKKFDAIVTVSTYWENYFKQKGYKNVHKIYNACNLRDFNFTEEEVQNFKKEYNLTDKPIIYIGNCRKDKGVIESYKTLKGMDIYLVTSGKRMVNIPVINIDSNYRDYLKLLKDSMVVVTMSKFKEGWCRTVQEAMLCKTPVIGSGLGGMKEILEGGEQIICEDFNLLREKVEYLLNHPEIREKMGEVGFNFAQNFTIEKFKKDWLNLIKALYS